MSKYQKRKGGCWLHTGLYRREIRGFIRDVIHCEDPYFNRGFRLMLITKENENNNS